MFGELFHQAGGAEGEVDTSLLHSLQALCRNFDGDLAVQFRDEYRLLLEVYLAAAFAGCVEFGRTCAVRIPAHDAGSFAGDCAFAGHMSGNYTILGRKKQRGLCLSHVW